MSIWNQAYEDFRAPYYEEEKKAKKDYDGDGKVESGSKEHAGAVHNAIQRAKGGKPDGKDTRKEGIEVEEGYKEIDKKKENKMYRRAGNLARTALSSKGKKKETAMNKSNKIVSAIARQKENERFSKMGDEKARSNYKEESEIEEGMKQARKNVGASTCWDGYKAQGTKKKGGKEVPNCVKEEEVVDEGMKPYPAEKVARKREAVKKKEDIHIARGEYDKADKQYKRGVALSFKKKMKKEHADWRAEMGFIDEASCDSDKPKEKKGVKNKVTVMPDVKTENVQGGPLLPGEGRKVYPKGAAPKKTGATLPLANSYEPEGEVIEGYVSVEDGVIYLEGNQGPSTPVRIYTFPDGSKRVQPYVGGAGAVPRKGLVNKQTKPTTQVAHFEPEGEMLDEKKGLYANIHAKRARGEAPAKPGDKDYPAKDAFKKAAKTAKKEEFELDEADSLAAMQARREKRLARQRKQMGTSSTGQDFGHDYGISSAERKKRQQAEFDKFVGRGKKDKKDKKEEVEFAGNYEGPLYAPHPDLAKESLLDKVLKTYVSEEDYDRMKDRRMQRGGVGGNKRYDRPYKEPNTKKFGSGKTMAQKEMEKKYGKGASAMDIVKANIEKKYGKGAVMGKKKKDD